MTDCVTYVCVCVALCDVCIVCVWLAINSQIKYYKESKFILSLTSSNLWLPFNGANYRKVSQIDCSIINQSFVSEICQQMQMNLYNNRKSFETF